MNLIQWTDTTRNFLLVKRWIDGKWKIGWWCLRKSSGCKNCYACTLNLAWGSNAARRGCGSDYKMQEVHDLEPVFDRKALHSMLRWRKPRRVFTVDMSDAFLSVVVCKECKWTREIEDRIVVECEACGSTDLKHFWPSEWLQEMLDVYDELASKGHVVQSLTKRPRRLSWELLRWSERHDRKLHSGVWLGFSAEDQDNFDERWSVAQRWRRYANGPIWVSYEPALGPVDFYDALVGTAVSNDGGHAILVPRLGWIVAGGESGTGARSCQLSWIESCVGQCLQAGVPVFVKQLGSRVVFDECFREQQHLKGPRFDFSWPPWLVGGEGGLMAEGKGWGAGWNLDRKTGHYRLRHKKGGDPEEWPEVLRRREFPE